MIYFLLCVRNELLWVCSDRVLHHVFLVPSGVRTGCEVWRDLCRLWAAGSNGWGSVPPDQNRSTPDPVQTAVGPELDPRQQLHRHRMCARDTWCCSSVIVSSLEFILLLCSVWSESRASSGWRETDWRFSCRATATLSSGIEHDPVMRFNSVLLSQDEDEVFILRCFHAQADQMSVSAQRPVEVWASSDRRRFVLSWVWWGAFDGDHHLVFLQTTSLYSCYHCFETSVLCQ